jgi:hypothetical protein
MRPFFVVTACVWLALFMVAFVYAQHGAAGWIWTAALPAFIFETIFYVGSVT